MIKDKACKNIVGHVKYVGKNADDEIVYGHEHDVSKGEHNTVTKLYYILVADLLAGGSDGVIAYGHAGTSSGGDEDSTNLATHCDEARTAVDSITQTGGTNVMVVVFTLGAGVCTATLTECGLFVASAQATADLMLYDDSINFAKAAGDSLEITWTITHEN